MPIYLASIHSSPLLRCAALARRLAPVRAAVIAPELLELDYRSWEGSAIAYGSVPAFVIERSSAGFCIARQVLP
jgi:hypothetical protein